MCAIPKTPEAQRGVATVEIVIVLPLLLFLLVATFEIGRGLFQYNTLTKAVRDGARYIATEALAGTLGTVNLTGKIAPTQNLVVYGNTNGVGSSILPNLTVADVSVATGANQRITVSASYAYTPALFTQMPNFGFGGGQNLQLTLTATSVMRAL
jgi:Flp pilus assembly protein TadG